MAGYVIADVEVLDPAGYEEYRRGVPATIAAYGGRYLVRGGAAEVAEGGWTPMRVVILEFESAAQAKAWLESPEYRPLRQIRQRCAKSKVVVVEGFVP
jgi:uncharacterized protein (DUF1330 family)